MANGDPVTGDLADRDHVSWRQIRVAAFILLLFLSAIGFLLLFPDLKPHGLASDAIGYAWLLGLFAVGAGLKALARPFRRAYLDPNPTLERSLKLWAVLGVCLLSALVCAAAVAMSLHLNF